MQKFGGRTQHEIAPTKPDMMPELGLAAIKSGVLAWLSRLGNRTGPHMSCTAWLGADGGISLHLNILSSPPGAIQQAGSGLMLHTTWRRRSNNLILDSRSRA